MTISRPRTKTAARKKTAKKPAKAGRSPTKTAKAAAARTPTTLATPGGKARNGVSPSGFTMVPNYMEPELYEQRLKRPAFLNVLPADPAPCTNCPSRCCHANVVLNVCDLVRLAGPLLVHPSSVCNLTFIETRNGASVLIGDTPKHIMLRKNPEQELCVLLLDVDGHRRCGVHALRPGICRIYPFSYRRGTRLYQMGHVICPTQWVMSKEAVDRVLTDIEQHEQDRVVDRRIVQRWNDTVPVDQRTAPAFWDYAMREAGAALGVDVSFMFRQPQRQKLGPALW